MYRHYTYYVWQPYNITLNNISNKQIFTSSSNKHMFENERAEFI